MVHTCTHQGPLIITMIYCTFVQVQVQCTHVLSLHIIELMWMGNLIKQLMLQILLTNATVVHRKALLKTSPGLGMGGRSLQLRKLSTCTINMHTCGSVVRVNV